MHTLKPESNLRAVFSKSVSTFLFFFCPMYMSLNELDITMFFGLEGHMLLSYANARFARYIMMG